MSMTVANEPRFEGERKPKSAKTEGIISITTTDTIRSRTERDARHSDELGTISDENRERHRPSGRAENFSVNELPAKIFLDIFLTKPICTSVSVHARKSRED